ncbi:MAG: hypothetical protein QNJ54_30045 [Prochloraceae cyanobacterium]|nr:hypothetical protein [Prochloraceae cyanobacterium]
MGRRGDGKEPVDAPHGKCRSENQVDALPEAALRSRARFNQAAKLLPVAKQKELFLANIKG